MDHKKLNDLQLKIAEFEMILSELGTYIYTKDLNGCYTYMNQQLLNIFKANYEDVIGKQDKDFFDLQISDQMQRNDQRVILENISLQINESSFIKALGETKVFNSLKKPTYNSDGKLVGMLAICKDITENKPAVSTEKAQKHLLNAVLNHLDAYIYIKDHRRIFKYVNRNVARLLGKPIDQIVGEKDIDVLGKEIADDYWQSEKLVLETKKKHTFEESHRGKDGLLRHYFSVKIPYQIDKKTPAVIGFSTDITELYQLKEELKNLERPLPCPTVWYGLDCTILPCQAGKCRIYRLFPTGSLNDVPRLSNVGFTCKVVWRGPCASTVRDKRLCQVEALVSLTIATKLKEFAPDYSVAVGSLVELPNCL